MPDTGAPWNIPYVAGTDLVSDWPTDSQTLAEAIADGLDAARGLVAVKHAIKTDTQTSSSIAARDSVAVTGLSITHTMADAANKLIISAYFGAAANSYQFGNTGIAVADDGVLVGIGDTAAGLASVAAGGFVSTPAANQVVAMPSITFVYEPGDTASHTYTVHAVNIETNTRTLYINRSEVDTSPYSRASSALVIQEVNV